uniref:Uncharacterized protein n=1 Tax=Arundo donax TaxID=35708 RepID=A0A0A8Z557_ARUDO
MQECLTKSPYTNLTN